jgi:hypothetical protein
MMYAWLNLETGEFSNSWTEEEHKRVFDEFDKKTLKEHFKGYPQWKLIRYECVNDKDFKFVHHMKLR